MRPLCLIVLLSTGCASQQNLARAERLYFALELRHEGKLVGKPKLLGEAGHRVMAERRAPGAAAADYELVLDSSAGLQGSFALELDVALPEARGHSKLELLHGEVRELELGLRPGELQVTLLVMKVDSSEFEALMSLAAPTRPRTAGSI